MKLQKYAIVLAALLLAAGTASAKTETYKIDNPDDPPLDPVYDRNFGNAVGVDGNTAIIGAQSDDDAGAGSGSAYVFDTTGGTELFKLTATDAAAGDYFGNAVAISGNVAIVAAYGDDDGGSGSGSAYLFDVTTGLQLHKLTATDAAAADAFGFSVSISGNRAIVGAYSDDDGGSKSGSAYVFDVATGTELYKLTASDAAGGAEFGSSVAIDGNYAAVGARSAGASWSLKGKAYLYNVGSSAELGMLQASDIANFAYFGWSVAIDDDTLVVGSPGSKNGVGSYTGSAYVFDVLTQTELAKLTASDQAGYDWFGRTVAIDGDLIVAGAPENDDAGSKSGSAYFFDGTTYAELDKLTASDAAADDRFGNSVAVSGGYTVVGINEFKADVNAAYVFVTAAGVVKGDFNGDDKVDADDIDALGDAIRLSLTDVMYDLSGVGEDGIPDTAIDVNDLDYLVHQLVETTMGVGTGSEYGDFNLDGLVDTTDLTRLATYFGPGTKWAEGNANRNIDLMIDTTDLTILGTYFGFDASVDAIPEPATLFVMGCGAAGILRKRRSKIRRGGSKIRRGGSKIRRGGRA